MRVQRGIRHCECGEIVVIAGAAICSSLRAQRSNPGSRLYVYRCTPNLLSGLPRRCAPRNDEPIAARLALTVCVTTQNHQNCERCEVFVPARVAICSSLRVHRNFRHCERSEATQKAASRFPGERRIRFLGCRVAARLAMTLPLSSPRRRSQTK
jgi:hypothetical protein